MMIQLEPLDQKDINERLEDVADDLHNAFENIIPALEMAARKIQAFANSVPIPVEYKVE